MLFKYGFETLQVIESLSIEWFGYRKLRQILKTICLRLSRYNKLF